MNLYTLFIDPASKSTGWALYENKKCIKHGTIIALGNIGDRLYSLYIDYEDLFSIYKPKEIHIEQFGGRPHRYLIMSVGILFAAGHRFNVTQDIAVKTWQKWCCWSEIKDKWQVKKDFKSEDEWAAYQMGMWYVNRNLIIF